MKISIGNSNTGYDSAQVVKTAAGKYKLNGEIYGRKSVIKKAIANLNRGDNSYITPAGDYFQINVIGK